MNPNLSLDTQKALGDKIGDCIRFNSKELYTLPLFHADKIFDFPLYFQDF